MNKEIKIQNLIKKWQKVLGLKDWMLKVEFVDFERTDYKQSGDVKVDLKNKKATILFSNNPQKDDEYIVVHELVHLLLWEYDHFNENLIPKNKKDRYSELLEKTVDNLTVTLLRKNIISTRGK